MILRSFAILLPCGVDLFSGVEFVCCPTSVKQLIQTGYGQELLDNEQVRLVFITRKTTSISREAFDKENSECNHKGTNGQSELLSRCSVIIKSKELRKRIS